jgi:hypothetical protein
MDNGIVDLWSLPENKIYLDLEKSFKEKIFKSAKEYARTWDKLGKNIGFSVNKYGSCKIIESARCKRFSLSLLNKILDYLSSNGADIDKSCIERKISVISSKRGGSNKLANSIFNPKLPFNFNTVDGATVLSAIFHDGGIDSRLLPHYCNPENIELRKKIYEAFTKVFGEFKSKKSDPVRNQQLYFPKIVGIVLVYGLGLSYGRKVVNNPSIPKFLFDSSKNVKSAYVQQAFDDEAHVHRHDREISLKLASSSEKPANLLTGLKRLLEEFDIDVNNISFSDFYKTKEGDKASRWVLSITHQDNLKTFYDRIGFYTSYKEGRLKEIVKTLKCPHYSVKRCQKIYVNACAQLQKRYSYIMSKELSIEINRSQTLAKKIIQKFVKNKILLIKEHRHGNRGAKYILSDNYESLCKM